MIIIIIRIPKRENSGLRCCSGSFKSALNLQFADNVGPKTARSKTDENYQNYFYLIKHPFRHKLFHLW